jgi:hypothetical protein
MSGTLCNVGALELVAWSMAFSVFQSMAHTHLGGLHEDEFHTPLQELSFAELPVQPMGLDR